MQGTTVGVTKGDTRSLDCSSHPPSGVQGSFPVAYGNIKHYVEIVHRALPNSHIRSRGIQYRVPIYPQSPGGTRPQP